MRPDDPQRDDALLAISDAWDREPWEPVRFEVGDRVAIHRSAECPYSGYAMHGEGAGIPDGTIGEVWMLFAPTFGEPTSDGHDVFVAFHTDPEGRTSSGWFAVCELQPAATAGGDGAGEG